MRLLFWSCLLVASSLAALPQVDVNSPLWKFESEHDGVSLYSCPVQGTGVVPCKAVMQIPGSIEEISLVLEDVARRGEWISHYGKSKLLKRVNYYDQTEYLRMHIPWPFDDRTTLVRVLISVSDDLNTATVTARSVTGTTAMGLYQGVWAQVYESSFQMRRSGEGTEVTGVVFIDPQGHLPIWVVNLFTGKVARKTLEGLKQQVVKKLYSDSEIKTMHQRIQAYAAFLNAHPH